MTSIASGRTDGAAAERPVVQVRIADAGDIYLTWRWISGPQGYGTGIGPGADAIEPLAALAEALPTSGSPERLRSVLSGPLADPKAEAGFAAALGEALWPAALTGEIKKVIEVLGRPLVRIQPSPSHAAIPWELLAVDGDTRLIELADVATTAPLTLRSGRGAGAPPGPPVYILDPAIPGVGRGSGLGPVLTDPATDPHLAVLADRAAETGAVPTVEHGRDLFRRNDIDRVWLAEHLQSGADRLLYVGHVTAAPVDGGQSEDTRMHLACRATAEGLAPPIRGHRPLSAKDLLLGDLPLHADGRPGTEIWPAPSRVALIGCDSGGDARYIESFGLASAMLFSGADIVTAARWTLPTDHAMHRLGDLDTNIRPLSSLVLAVDMAHIAPDPIGAIGDWQRERLAAWRANGSLADAPLLWAAITSIVM